MLQLTAQTFAPDSLRNALNSKLNFRQQVDVYQNIIDGYLKSENHFSTADYQTALGIAIDNNYQPGIARLHFAYLNFYSNTLPEDTLLPKINYCINVFRNFSLKKELAQSYYLLGKYYQQKQKNTLAAFNFIEGIHAIANSKETALKRSFYLALSEIYASVKLLNEVLYFAEKGLSMFVEPNDSIEVLLNFQKATIFLQQSNYSQAKQVLSLIDSQSLNASELLSYYAILLEASNQQGNPAIDYKSKIQYLLANNTFNQEAVNNASLALINYYKINNQSDSLILLASQLFKTGNTLQQLDASRCMLEAYTKLGNTSQIAIWLNNYFSADDAWNQRNNVQHTELLAQFFKFRYITDDAFETSVGRYAKFKPMFYITLLFFVLLFIVFVVAYLNLITKKNYEQSVYKKQINYNKKLIEVKDIEVMQAKENARESDKIKNVFVAEVANDLQKQFQGMQSVQTELHKQVTDAFTIKNLATLEQYVYEITQQIDKLKQFDKIGSGGLILEKVPFNMKHLLSNVKELFMLNAKEKQLDFEIQIDDTIPDKILGDPLRINQLFINLIGNAIKYTKEGYVHVNIKRELLTQNNILIHISVKDTGIGIDDAFKDLIFSGYDAHALNVTPDTTANRGLGLSVTQKIVEAMGSKITLVSQPGLGSTFTVNLNFEIAKPELTAKEIEAKQYESILRGKKILIIESDVMNLMVLKQFAQNWGIKPVIALNGNDALKQLQNEQFDMILVDMQMPNKDGFKTAKMLRESENRQINKLPIIALTADKENKLQNEVIALGMNDIVYKPYDPDKLRQRMALLLQHAVVKPETLN